MDYLSKHLNWVVKSPLKSRADLLKKENNFVGWVESSALAEPLPQEKTQHTLNCQSLREPIVAPILTRRS